MSIKSPEDMQSEYANNVENGAQAVVHLALNAYGANGKRCVITIYSHPTESVKIAASRLNDAGWAVEFAIAADNVRHGGALSLASRPEYISRRVQKYGKTALQRVLMSATVFAIALFLLAITGPTILLSVILLASASLLAYTGNAFFKRAAHQQMLSAQLSDGNWQAFKLREIDTN